jgi:hypothetical protein
MDNGDTGKAGEVVADQKPGSTQAQRKLVGPVGHALRGVLKTKDNLTLLHIVLNNSTSALDCRGPVFTLSLLYSRQNVHRYIVLCAGAYGL